MDEQKLNSFVRPTVTIFFTLLFCYLCVVGKISDDAALATITMTLTWWFKARDEQKKS